MGYITPEEAHVKGVGYLQCKTTTIRCAPRYDASRLQQANHAFNCFPEDALINESDSTRAFQQLEPHHILDAIDSHGWFTDGRVSALNSYENRVYQIGLEDGGFIIAKFYRPQRWSDDAIREEHSFTAHLVEHDIPAVAPLVNEQGDTLLTAGPFRFVLFERVGGRPPELDNDEQLLMLGRTVARMHAIGETRPFQHRRTIDAAALGDQSVNYLLESESLPPSLLPAYQSIAVDMMAAVHAAFETSANITTISLHGDCHPGNLLIGADGTPQLLDFDDAGTGPAIQDLWMFISGDRRYAEARLGPLLDGYFEFREFDERELVLIEPLRALRILHYAAWIARRWQDPAFQQAFPFFAEQRFWDEHILSLREQQARLDEKPLIY